MKCTKLTVVNFCQHRHQVVEFSDGLTAIIGTNGSGKSNLLGAIRLAMTGENPNVGPKAANICDLAPETERSYVELEFSHAGTDAVVRRNLRPASPTATLTIVNTGETINGDTKVTAKIEEILGIDKATVNDIVIVAQDEIFGFLDRTPAKRAAQFQKLFHTEKAELVYKVIGDHLKGIQIPAVGGDLDELQQRIDQATNTAREVEQNLAGIPSFQDIQANREHNAQCVRDFDERAGLQQRLVQVSEQRQQAQEAKAAAVQAKAQRQSELTTVEQAHAGNCEAAQQARVKLASLSQVKQNQATRTQTTNAIASLTEQLEALVVPEKPADYEDATTLTTRATQLASQKTSLEAFLQSFDGDTVECPTCGTPTDQLADKLEEARKLLNQTINDHESVIVQQSKAFTYDQQFSRYNQQLQLLEGQRSQATDYLNTLPNTPVEQVDEAALQQSIDNELTFSEGIEELRNLLNGCNTEIGRHEGQIETLTNQVNQINERLSQLTAYTPKQRAQAESSSRDQK